MESLKMWLNCLDEIKESKVKPFKKHLLGETLNDHELNTFVVLQTAFVLFNGSISTNQERLYQFYLPALSSELKISEIITQAQNITEPQLKEHIELLEAKGLLFYFLLDVLVFSRIEGDVSDEFKNVLNSFCHSLAIKKEDIDQVVYLSDCILGIEPDEKPELFDVFFELINNPVWVEFFSNNITTENIQEIDGGIWCVDEVIELHEATILWKNSVIIFNGLGRLDHTEGSLTIEKSSLISPIINTRVVSIKMDAVEVKGTYELDKKLTAFTLQASPQVSVKNASFMTKNARTFSFELNSTSATFENTDFIKCGNPSLLGGAVSFVEKVYFNDCNFIDCKAQVGGALFFKLSYQDNMVGCHFKNCLSTTEWEEKANAGAVYFEQSGENASSFIDCNIKADLSVYVLPCYDGELSNTFLSGLIHFNSSTYSSYKMLDEESIALSGITHSNEKNKKSNNVKSYSELIEEFS